MASCLICHEPAVDPVIFEPCPTESCRNMVYCRACLAEFLEKYGSKCLACNKKVKITRSTEVYGDATAALLRAEEQAAENEAVEELLRRKEREIGAGGKRVYEDMLDQLTRRRREEDNDEESMRLAKDLTQSQSELPPPAPSDMDAETERLVEELKRKDEEDERTRRDEEDRRRAEDERVAKQMMREEQKKNVVQQRASTATTSTSTKNAASTTKATPPIPASPWSSKTPTSPAPAPPASSPPPPKTITTTTTSSTTTSTATSSPLIPNASQLPQPSLVVRDSKTHLHVRLWDPYEPFSHAIDLKNIEQCIKDRIRFYRVRYNSRRFDKECETPCYTNMFGGPCEGERAKPFQAVPSFLQPLLREVRAHLRY